MCELSQSANIRIGITGLTSIIVDTEEQTRSNITFASFCAMHDLADALIDCAVNTTDAARTLGLRRVHMRNFGISDLVTAVFTSRGFLYEPQHPAGVFIGNSPPKFAKRQNLPSRIPPCEPRSPRHRT